MSRAIRLALCLQPMLVSCQGHADPKAPDTPPRETVTMSAHHDESRTERILTMRCRIYFGCVATPAKSSD
jgi:hypothetical protein